MVTPFSQQVPSGKAITVRIIDSTSRISGIKAKVLVTADITGFDVFPKLPTWSFLIEHDSGRRLLFDLGIPTDWDNHAPSVSKRLKENGWGIEIEKPTVDILKEHNVDVNSVEGIVWSHWHWDHIGNPSTFPRTTKVIVGPDFKKEMLPAYPTNPKANVRELDFEGRELQEVTFTEPNSLKIGSFPAYDYFGDGSFYLLDTPGHAVGHLAGLARTTTNPPTFIFMGGDLTHHSSELRPNPFLPLPDSIPASLIPNLVDHLSYTTACPGSLIENLQSTRGRKPPRETPFFDPSMGKSIPQAIETIKKVYPADADENVFYIFAHDRFIEGVVDLMPKPANAWKENGWRQKLLWKFLEDFEVGLKELKDKMEAEGSKL